MSDEENYDDDFTPIGEEVEDEIEDVPPKKSKKKTKSKKRKREEVEEPEEPKVPLPQAVQAEDYEVRCQAKANYKKLKLNHWDEGIDKKIREIEEFDKELDGLTTQELIDKHNNLKIAIGLKNPGQTAQGLIGLAGLGLGRVFSLDDFGSHLARNHELCSIVEGWIPDFSHLLAPPIQAAFLIAETATNLKTQRK